MTEFQYLEKRDDRGVFLRYSAHELAFDASSKALDLIRGNAIYSSLVSKIPKKYVDLYYLKIVYVAFLPVADQLVIYQHDKVNNEEKHPRKICANGFPSRSLLKGIWPTSDIDFSFSNEIGVIKEKIKRLVLHCS